MKAKIRVKNPFKVLVANQMYNHMAKDSHVSEWGIDSNGYIYFHYLNGNTKKYSRSEFIKIAREWEADLRLLMDLEEFEKHKKFTGEDIVNPFTDVNNEY